MDTLQKTLFIGNGLNRCLDGITWNGLLDSIAKQLGVVHDPNIDMPLEFERIMFEHLKQTNCPPRIDCSPAYYAVKSQISAAMTTPESLGKCVHKEIPFNVIQNVVTSNYDLVLEKACSEVYSVQFNAKRTSQQNYKYLLRATDNIKHLSFYHPHGVITYPSSICLGYEHYMGLVSTIRPKVNKVRKLPGNDKNNIHRILEGIDPCTNEVWEKYYTSDMAFVGFGLPNCESDIWWLLTHRAYLFYSNENHAGKLINNHIIYYDVIKIEKETEDDIKRVNDHFEFIDPSKHYSIKHKQLCGMHVEVRIRVVFSDKEYEDAFRSILHELADTKNWNPPKDFK